MPLIATRGASSVQGFGQFAQATAANYIEDVFSTYIYTGNGSTQTITNGIDLSTNGGLVWIKPRSLAFDHRLFDTVRGVTKTIKSNLDEAQDTQATSLTAFNSTGFTLSSSSIVNGSSSTYASWTFRKQPKFFDIVTWTGNSVAGREISHNLGSTPGCIIIKKTSAAGNDWAFWHRGVSTEGGRLNQTGIFEPGYYNAWVNATQPTSTVFTVSSDGTVNATGATYIAYLFAHDAGGFGLTGSDNVVSCGSYTGSGGTTTPLQVTLGYEPQWVLVKPSSAVGNWAIADTMRGMTRSSNGESLFSELQPNSAGSENAGNYGPAPTATGFAVSGTGFPNTSGTTYIYIAIRRGPMKVPTDATKVFTPVVANTQVFETAGFPVDMVMNQRRDSGANLVTDRLRNAGVGTYSDGNESSFGGFMPSTGYWDNMTGYTGYFQSPGSPAVYWNFRRAPSFFDIVNWYITGSADLRIKHNLTVTPELIIPKARSQSLGWYIYHKDIGVNGYAVLNTTAAASSASGSFGTPTATEIGMNTSGFGYTSFNYAVSYLFATCPGVSKVGSYTGTGTTLQINCGFTAGARFVLIKRTDSTGDWYVWDTARGIISGNDPYLLLNSASAEATSTDYIDTYSAGFELSSTAPAAINASAGTYIFLAIA